MASKKIPKTLTIIIGGDMDKDLEEMLERPEKAIVRPPHVLYLDTYEQLHDLLSPAKIDVLHSIISYDTSQEPDIKGLAKQAKRKQEAVSRDVHALEKMKLVELKKKGRHVHVSTPFKSIQIQFA